MSFEFDALHPDVRVWVGLKAGERDRAMRCLDAEIGRLTVAKTALIHECERTQVFAEDCFRTVGQWVRAVGNTSRGTATGLVQMAKMFALLPKVAGAFAAGTIGVDQVRLLVELWANPRCRDQLAGFEDFLLDSASSFVLHEFREVCQAWRPGDTIETSRREPWSCCSPHRKKSRRRSATTSPATDGPARRVIWVIRPNRCGCGCAEPGPGHRCRPAIWPSPLCTPGSNGSWSTPPVMSSTSAARPACSADPPDAVLYASDRCRARLPRPPRRHPNRPPQTLGTIRKNRSRQRRADLRMVQPDQTHRPLHRQTRPHRLALVPTRRHRNHPTQPSSQLRLNRCARPRPLIRRAVGRGGRPSSTALPTHRGDWPSSRQRR